MSTKSLFSGDIVRRSSGEVAMILRTPSEEDSRPLELPPGTAPSPIDRPLLRNEVGISTLIRAPTQTDPSASNLNIVKSEELELIDRLMQPGDIVKRSWDKEESGVVTKVEVGCRLKHVLSGQEVEGWVSSDELEGALKTEVGDRVIYNNWLGVVEEIFEEGTLEVEATGQTWKVADMGAMLDHSRTAAELYPDIATLPALPQTRWFSTSAPRDPTKERVVEVRPLVVSIAWMAINQKLPIQLQDSCPKPKRFFSGKEMKDLKHVTSPSDHLPQTGTKVCFRSSELEKKHGLVPTLHADNTISLSAMSVRETATSVTVLWQDGTSTTERTINLILFINIDEYSCWPGDHVLFKGGEEGEKVAIVQRVSTERTAEIQLIGTEGDDPSTRETILVSLLELDPHGQPPDTFGVARGDLVLIGSSSNGCEPPRVPRIGEVYQEPVLDEELLRQTMSRLAASASALAAFESTRSFLAASLGFAVAASEDSSAPSSSDDPATSSRKREMVMSKELGEIDWYGEVKDLKLDGMIEVMLPSGKVVEVEMERLNILNEEGDPHDHGGGSIGSEEERLEDEDGEWEDMVGDEDLLLDGEGGEGEVVEFVEERDEWEDAEEGEEGGPMDVEEETEDREEGLLKRKRADTNAETNNASPASPSTTSPAALQPLTTSSDPSLAPASSNGVSLPTSSSPSSLAPQPPQPSTSLPSSSRLQPPKKDDPSWQRFLVLEDAPEDHHFYTEPIGKPNSAFFSRLQKEFKVLASSLPDTILVRTYEDRMDLLRCVILGPAGTPYIDAPHVIDFYLDPKSFPFDPPKAYFHSWTNGRGRVNPNLYEEGKVCLSILGTWAGEQSESWNSHKSSLLQIFVSIQSLVLVREPYFCEPAFEKLRGTKEAEVNSRQYSEKAYVLSRAFILHVLTHPVSSLADEFLHYYRHTGVLDRVLDGADKLIAVSVMQTEVQAREGGATLVEWNAGDGVDRLTLGARLPLERTMASLRKIRDAWREEDGKEV